MIHVLPISVPGPKPDASPPPVATVGVALALGLESWVAIGRCAPRSAPLVRATRPMAAAMLACFVLAIQCLAAVAAAQEELAPGSAVDVAAIVDKLEFAGDGKGHWVAMIPFHEDNAAHVYWSADGKRFNALRITGGSRQGDVKFDKVFWEPRVAARWQAGVGKNEDGWWVQCFDRKTILKAAEGNAKKALVDAVRSAKITFVAQIWERRAYGLVRDDTGTYWYIDRGVGEKSKNFRVFSGQRGQLKPLPLTNTVSDSEGDIFATKSGSLRLVLSKQESTWVQGKGQKKLTVLPLEDNYRLIYTDLGVYLGQRLGTPCDDL